MIHSATLVSHWRTGSLRPMVLALIALATLGITLVLLDSYRGLRSRLLWHPLNGMALVVFAGLLLQVVIVRG